MRALLFFILVSFSVQTVDVPPLSTQTNPKTCCARKICLCTHAKGAPCDYKARKAMEEKKSKEQGSDCPFHKGMKKESASNGAVSSQADSARLAVPADKGGPVLTQAPCHTNTPKSSLPGTVRDYEPPPALFEINGAGLFKFVNQNLAVFYLSPGLSGPDHPPRAFPSL